MKIVGRNLTNDRSFGFASSQCCAYQFADLGSVGCVHFHGFIDLEYCRRSYKDESIPSKRSALVEIPTDPTDADTHIERNAIYCFCVLITNSINHRFFFEVNHFSSRLRLVYPGMR